MFCTSARLELDTIVFGGVWRGAISHFRLLRIFYLLYCMGRYGQKVYYFCMVGMVGIVGMMVVFGDEGTLIMVVTLVSHISVTFSLLCSECLK